MGKKVKKVVSEMKDLKQIYLYKDRTLYDYITSVEDPLFEVPLQSIDPLNDKTVSDVVFSGLSFTNKFFNRVFFDNCEFIGCKFTGCNMDQVQFGFCTIRNCYFTYSSMIASDIAESTIIESSFRNVSFDSADILNTIFKDNDIKSCSFIHTEILKRIPEECKSKLDNMFQGNYITHSIFALSRINVDIFYNARYISAKHGSQYIVEGNTTLNNSFLNTDLSAEAAQTLYYPTTCPSEGEFIGWKKVKGQPVGAGNCYYGYLTSCSYLVKLLIPADAKRSSATSYKCRCSKAKVLGIYNLDGSEVKEEVDKLTKYVSIGGPKPIEYKVGEMIYPDDFNENRWKECSNGIHFFVDKEAAIRYNM